MEISVIKLRLFELVAERIEQEVDECSLNVPLSDLGVDSLMALELAVYLEREFGFRMTEQQLASVQSIQSILDLIEESRN